MGGALLSLPGRCHGPVGTVARVSPVQWVLSAAGAAAAGCLLWIVAGAVHASVRSTAAVRRDTILLDELFDGTQRRVLYRTGAGRTGGPTATVLIAGATDRGYRFVEANRRGGRTTMEFHRTHRHTSDT